MRNQLYISTLSLSPGVIYISDEERMYASILARNSTPTHPNGNYSRTSNVPIRAHHSFHKLLMVGKNNAEFHSIRNVCVCGCVHTAVYLHSAHHRIVSASHTSPVFIRSVSSVLFRWKIGKRNRIRFTDREKTGQEGFPVRAVCGN